MSWDSQLYPEHGGQALVYSLLMSFCNDLETAWDFEKLWTTGIPAAPVCVLCVSTGRLWWCAYDFVPFANVFVLYETWRDIICSALDNAHWWNNVRPGASLSLSRSCPFAKHDLSNRNVGWRWSQVFHNSCRCSSRTPEWSHSGSFSCSWRPLRFASRTSLRGGFSLRSWTWKVDGAGSDQGRDSATGHPGRARIPSFQKPRSTMRCTSWSTVHDVCDVFCLLAILFPVLAVLALLAASLWWLRLDKAHRDPSEGVAGRPALSLDRSWGGSFGQSESGFLFAALHRRCRSICWATIRSCRTSSNRCAA